MKIFQRWKQIDPVIKGGILGLVYTIVVTLLVFLCFTLTSFDSSDNCLFFGLLMAHARLFEIVFDKIFFTNNLLQNTFLYAFRDCITYFLSTIFIGSLIGFFIKKRKN